MMKLEEILEQELQKWFPGLEFKDNWDWEINQISASSRVAFTEHIAEKVVYLLVERQLIKGNSLRPLLTGFAGGTDQPYFDHSLGYLDQNYQCWFQQ